MDYQLSTSSIKMSGIPLLPPLVTNNITTEIQYYKQLAIAVEQRLKALEIASQNALERSKDPYMDNVHVSSGNHDILVDIDFKSQTDNVAHDLSSSTATLIEYPTKDNTENLIDMGVPTNEKSNEIFCFDKDINISEPQHTAMEQINKSTSDGDKSYSNDTMLGDSVSSDQITGSTDLNQYLNLSVSTKTETETSPEIWKPQVPKTLDIVPITVDQSKPSDKPGTSNEEVPKLVRRGSYVLDTPSPVLLAHMQKEMSNAEYTPTSSKTEKRPQWNISEVKTHWVTQSNFKEPAASRANSASKLKRGNQTNIPSHRVSKSLSNSKSGSPLDVQQPANSVDCIRSMFAKECYSPKTVKSKVGTVNQKYSSPVNGTNGIRNNSFKKPIKNSASLSRLTGSLGSLNSVNNNNNNNNNNTNTKVVRPTDRKKSADLISNKSVGQDSIKSNDSNIPKKKKPVITSEKIVSVFKEIQETHKKQMIELISRQQKEQLTMQENFKRQQIVLLAQIRKAFPEISISALSEAICGKSTEQPTPLSSRAASEKSNSAQKQNHIDNPQINGFSHRNVLQKSPTPTDYPYQPREYSSGHGHCQATQTLGDPMVFSHCSFSSAKDIDDIPVGNPNRKYSTVSRQLFPLESKSMHVTVIDPSQYTEKHIKAATIINAHVKGFLVRRLMKTEKIIDLKNTYKEALQCMLRLHVDAPLNLPELNFHQRLQLQCDAASMNIVDLFSQSPTKRMEIIAHDREIKKARSERPSSSRSYSFATQRTLARKKLKDLVSNKFSVKLMKKKHSRTKMGVYQSVQSSMMSKSCPARTRCQTWTSNTKERKTTTSLINQGIKRSTSAGAVRKPWR